MQRSILHVLFLLTVIWAVCIFWIAPRPPLTDLPQHAGQVALLHDLLTGNSPWLDTFRINLFTPYLLGYGFAVALSFLVPVGVAWKLTLSLAYLAFVCALVQLRKHFGGDHRLDWLFLLSFFGPAYAWGLLTFLAAAPLAIFLILLADRYTQTSSFRLGLATALLGLLLLLSHGLVFVFGIAVSGAIYKLQRWPKRSTLGRFIFESWPLLIPIAACAAYFLISRQLEAQYGGVGNASFFQWDLNWKRLPKIFINSLGGESTLPVVICFIVLVSAPWVLGLRINRHRPATWLMFACTILIALLVPTFAMATGILYLRFALFTLPAYALMFTVPLKQAARDSAVAASATATGKSSGLARSLKAGVVPALVAVTWMVLGIHSFQTWRFAKESQDFEPVLAAMKPRERVLSLPLDPKSQAARNPFAYLHYGVWYQSEKQGLVDFNFAWLPPQVSRFKPDHLPAVAYGFEHLAVDFDWQKHNGELYRYFVVRHTGPLLLDIFRGAECAPLEILNSGAWTLFERHDCTPKVLPRNVGGKQ